MVGAWNLVCGRFMNFQNSRKILTLLTFGCPNYYTCTNTFQSATWAFFETPTLCMHTKQGCGVGVEESEGFSTWKVGVVKNFNDSDSGQTFCSPFVTVCATNVTLGNLSSLMLQQEMIMAIQTGGSALTCIPSLRGHSRSAASLGSSRNLHFVNATVRGLNFHLLILVGTIVAPWRWLRNSEWEFSCELVHCYVTHVTEQW